MLTEGETDGGRVDERTVEVHARFRHSAGRLGTHFLSVIRDQGCLVAWRTGNPSLVMIPPKDVGTAGEWVEVGPGATLEAYAPTDWVAREIGDGDGSPATLALVQIDGADTAILAWLRPPVPAARDLAPGTRLVSRFAKERAGAVTDFWFEPEVGGPYG